MLDSSNFDLSSETDPFLEDLVRLVNGSSIEISITILIKGAVISGHLISGKTYFQGLAEDMQEANANELIKEALQIQFNHRSTSYINCDDEDFVITSFIHLKDANILLSNIGSQITASYWRGKINEVDGFFLKA